MPPVQLQREDDARPRIPTLPVGFFKHREVLSEELLNCLQDIVDLQATFVKMKSSAFDTGKLCGMQASIESRLGCEGPICKKVGPTAGCCRLAAFITCFLSFTDIWANFLIPCKLSDMLWK